jgi:hypothetical protein
VVFQPFELVDDEPSSLVCHPSLLTGQLNPQLGQPAFSKPPLTILDFWEFRKLVLHAGVLSCQIAYERIVKHTNGFLSIVGLANLMILARIAESYEILVPLLTQVPISQQPLAATINGDTEGLFVGLFGHRRECCCD